MAHIVLVNPWIYDFAAFDLWQKPLGLLHLGGVLAEHGHRISLIDCLDRYHPQLPVYLNQDHLPRDRTFGTGKYPREEVQKPDSIKSVRRLYGRYGFPERMVREMLLALDEPEIFLVTSAMTYWYPGVIKIISLIKSIFPKAPVLLGGIYATLCRDHAEEMSGADAVLAGEAENYIVDAVNEYLPASTMKPRHYACLDDYPYPALHLYARLRSIPILSTRGCPLSCTFCASGAISGMYRRRSPELVAREVEYWEEKFGVPDFAFFDDALLVKAKRHFIPLMERIIGLRKNLRFHSPNGLSPALIDAEVAECMKQGGFSTIRLSLETVSPNLQNDINRKVSEKSFIRAVENLKNAGFVKEQLGTYILIGLPGQTMQEVLSTIVFAAECGVRINIAQFSPIPGTISWNKAVAEGSISGDIDFILTNKTLLPLRSGIFTWDAVQSIKDIVRSVNAAEGPGMDDVRHIFRELEERALASACT